MINGEYDIHDVPTEPLDTVGLRLSDLERRADWFFQTIITMAILLDQALPTNRLGNLLVVNPGTNNHIEARHDVQELYQQFRQEVKALKQYLADNR